MFFFFFNCNIEESVCLWQDTILSLALAFIDGWLPRLVLKVCETYSFSVFICYDAYEVEIKTTPLKLVFCLQQ